MSVALNKDLAKVKKTGMVLSDTVTLKQDGKA